MTKVRMGSCIGLGLLGVAGLAMFTLDAKAEITKTPQIQLQATCATVAAGKTQTLAKGANSILADGGTSWGAAGCDSYVVDTIVTSNSTPGSSYEAPITFSYEPGGPIGPPNNAQCEGTVITVHLYTKLDGKTTFSRVGGGTMKGKWNAAAKGDEFPCAVVSQPGFQNAPAPFNLPAAGKKDTYRVAISHKIAAAKKFVKAGMSHKPKPPA